MYLSIAVRMGTSSTKDRGTRTSQSAQTADFHGMYQVRIRCPSKSYGKSLSFPNF
jgi:hypothetical protein